MKKKKGRHGSEKLSTGGGGGIGLGKGKGKVADANCSILEMGRIQEGGNASEGNCWSFVSKLKTPRTLWGLKKKKRGNNIPGQERKGKGLNSLLVDYWENEKQKKKTGVGGKTIRCLEIGGTRWLGKKNQT